MSIRGFICALAVVTVSCSTPTEQVAPAPTGFADATIRPDTRVRGTIRSTNQQGQYVIVDFGLGIVPPLGTEMNVYENDQVTGVVKLTGPIRGRHVAADILSGEAPVGTQAIAEPADADEDVEE